MRIRFVAALAAVGALLCSCIPSLNPYYTSQDVVFESRLLGEWQAKDESDDPSSWKFEKGDDNGYQLTVTEKAGKHGEFSAHLFKLKENYFLDIIPTKCDYAPDQADLVGMCLVPGHLLLRVPQLGPELKLAPHDFDWLSKYLEKNPDAVRHHRDKDSIVLTAESRELQDFVLKHLGPGELFKEPGELVRKTPATAPRQ